MKKFTDFVKENEMTKMYHYDVHLLVEGLVHAFDEGQAGEEVDKEIDVLSDAISKTGVGAQMRGYTIKEIKEVLNPNTGENKVLESLDADREGELFNAGDKALEQIAPILAEFDGEELDYVINHILAGMQKMKGLSSDIEQLENPE
jgi:hypothetical protein